MISRMRTRTSGWLAAVAAAGVLVGLVALPPWVGEGARVALMHGFAAVCHQMPERSLHAGGVPLAVCHRCLGIYAGVLLGALVFPLVPRRALRSLLRSRRAGVLLIACGVPTAADWAAGALGLWANTPGSRMATGALFGVAAGLLLARALRQAFAAHPDAPQEAAL